MNIIEQLKNTIPKYFAEQPSTRKKIKFRPFTVKEEKTLLMANQTGNFDEFLITLSDIIDNCFELKNSAKTLPVFDIDYFFLCLRSKSVGEVIETKFTCPETNELVEITLDIDDIKPTYFENHNREVKVNDFMVFKMKYPSLEYMIKNNSDYYDMIIDCIESIETKDELIEAKNTSRDFIKQIVDLMTQPQFKQLVNFFQTMPKIEKEIEYQTSDGIKRKIILKGIRDFFQ